MQHLQNISPLYSATWQSPSNIALVKYWGKYGNQLPRNASVSITLSKSYTKTTVQLFEKKEKNNSIELQLFLDQQHNPKFEEKVLKFLNNLLSNHEFLFLKNFFIQILTHNSFPHSAGIASSASGMSALALCLCSLQKQLNNNELDSNTATFLQHASHIARLGSGSAARSVYGGAALWGQTDLLPNSSQTHAVACALHPTFEAYQNSILLVSKQEKSVSSTVGHSLMDTNPYAAVRYKQANLNLKHLLPALQSGDTETFIEVTENEALTLHALMMTSNPSFILMHPNSLVIIEKIRKFRADTQLPVCFTLDAGPNVHFLYPNYAQSTVQNFIETELLQFCDQKNVIDDCVGNGAFEIP